MKIASAQMKMSADMEQNFQKSVGFMRQAAAAEADLICFPEVQLSPFFAQYPGRNAEQYLLQHNSRYITEMCAYCKELGLYAAPNFYMEENGKAYDMSLLIDDRGKILGKQKMVHIAQCTHFYEQDYYTPAEEGFQVFQTKFGKIGIVVCFDRHYPESIRTEVLRGAELILIPTANTDAEPAEMFRWEIKVQAFQNSVNIVMCNRTGTEDEMTFTGESIAAAHNGETLMLADSAEGLYFAEIPLEHTLQARAEKPYTSLRRRACYE